MKLKLVELLTTLKTVYVSHLAASIAVTAIAGTVAVGGVGYGVYTASRPTPVEEVAVAEEVTPAETKESTSVETKPVKTETTSTASSEKVETEKKDKEPSTQKKEDKDSSKTEEKVTAKTEQKSSATAAETKKESSSAKTEAKPSAPAKSETTRTTPTKAEPAKEEAPKTHTHTWAHKDAVTETVPPTWVVDQPAHDDVIESQVEVTDYTTETQVIDGIVTPAGYPIGSHYETERTTVHYDEVGHWEYHEPRIISPAYDYCTECGARR